VQRYSADANRRCGASAAKFTPMAGYVQLRVSRDEAS
jgi:hypothetical protein